MKMHGRGKTTLEGGSATLSELRALFTWKSPDGWQCEATVSELWSHRFANSKEQAAL